MKLSNTLWCIINKVNKTNNNKFKTIQIYPVSSNLSKHNKTI